MNSESHHFILRQFDPGDAQNTPDGLQNFNTSAFGRNFVNAWQVTADLELPASSAEATPETVTTLEITSTAVLSNGEPIVAISSFINGDSLTIPQITDWLERHTSIRSGEIMLQADRRTPFSIMKRVMYTCSRAGYDDFTILVRQEG